jgi:hypothetical protein
MWTTDAGGNAITTDTQEIESFLNQMGGGEDEKPKKKESSATTTAAFAMTATMAEGAAALPVAGQFAAASVGSFALGREVIAPNTERIADKLGEILLALGVPRALLMAPDKTTDTQIAVPISATNDKKLITLFRGVNPTNSVQFLLALQGIAMPIGGSSTARDHSLGNTHSIYTSWSPDPNVAAWRGGALGVILKIQMNISDPRVFYNIFTKYPGEQEYLIIGPVTGAKVLKSWSTGTWNPTQIK